jgi:hypothetical protein
MHHVYKWAAAAALIAGGMVQSSLAAPATVPWGDSQAPSFGVRLSQLPRYSASGLHQCGTANGGRHSCVVTGLFSDCNEAASSLRTRDCCPTSTGGGTSTAFTLTYCIPDYSGR